MTGFTGLSLEQKRRADRLAKALLQEDARLVWQVIDEDLLQDGDNGMLDAFVGLAPWTLAGLLAQPPAGHGDLAGAPHLARVIRQERQKRYDAFGHSMAFLTAMGLHDGRPFNAAMIAPLYPRAMLHLLLPEDVPADHVAPDDAEMTGMDEGKAMTRAAAREAMAGVADWACDEYENLLELAAPAQYRAILEVLLGREAEDKGGSSEAENEDSLTPAAAASLIGMVKTELQNEIALRTTPVEQPGAAGAAAEQVREIAQIREVQRHFAAAVEQLSSGAGGVKLIVASLRAAGAESWLCRLIKSRIQDAAAVRYLKSEGNQPAIAREYGVHRVTMGIWVGAYQKAHPDWRAKLGLPPDANPSQSTQDLHPLEKREAAAVHYLTSGGNQQTTAAKYGADQTTIGRWVRAYKKAHPNWREELGLPPEDVP